MMNPTKLSIASLQQGFVDSFQGLAGDPQLALDYLMDLGKGLPAFPEAYRVEDHLVVGCLSRVWVRHVYDEGVLFLTGDSEAMVTKGLLAIVIHVFSGQRVSDIIKADLSFFETMGLPKLLGHQRRMGLGHIVQTVRDFATRYAKEG